DDDTDTCDMLAAVLALEGYETVQSQTAAKALSLATTETFDLIILDWKLRDGTGIELCQRIMEAGMTAPIVFYTGNETASLDQATKAGAVEIMLKPVEPKSFLQTVARLIGR